MDTGTKAVNREELFQSAMQTDAPTMDFVITRPQSAEDGLFFSQEGMEGINLAMAVWVGTRMMKRHEATGQPPSKMKVTVTVEMDDEPVTETGPRPFFIADGKHRVH